MNARVAEIETRLRAAFTPEQLEIVDESALHAGHTGARAGGGHYAVTIVSPRFSGQTAVARHRMIYQVLGELMARDIHALRIDAHAPDDF